MCLPKKTADFKNVFFRSPLVTLNLFTLVYKMSHRIELNWAPTVTHPCIVPPCKEEFIRERPPRSRWPTFQSSTLLGSRLAHCVWAKKEGSFGLAGQTAMSCCHATGAECTYTVLLDSLSGEGNNQTCHVLKCSSLHIYEIGTPRTWLFEIPSENLFEIVRRCIPWRCLISISPFSLFGDFRMTVEVKCHFTYSS